MSFWTKIESLDELRDAIIRVDADRPFNLILKHSTRCAISSMAKNRLERSPNSRVNYYIIDIIAYRALSNALSDETGVRHESPQSFLFANSALLDVKSHMAIDPGEIARRLQVISQS